MGSRGGFDEGGLAVSRRVRDIVGEQSPEWQTLQQGMVRRVLFGDANKQAIDFQPGEQAWKTMDTRISQALGEGRGAGWPRTCWAPTRRPAARDARDRPRQGDPGEGRQPVGLGLRGERAGRGPGQGGRDVGGGPGAYLGSMTGAGPVGALVGAGLGGGAAAAGGVMRDQLQARELRRLLGSYRAPKAGPGIDLPSLSTFGAGGLSDWLVRSGEALMPLTAAGRRTLRKLVFEHGRREGKAHLLRHGEQPRQREVEKGRDRQEAEG
jgi:hypothetical protein